MFAVCPVWFQDFTFKTSSSSPSYQAPVIDMFIQKSNFQLGDSFVGEKIHLLQIYSENANT